MGHFWLPIIGLFSLTDVTLYSTDTVFVHDSGFVITEPKRKSYNGYLDILPKRNSCISTALKS